MITASEPMGNNEGCEQHCNNLQFIKTFNVLN